MILNLRLHLNQIRNHRRELWLAFQLLGYVPGSMGGILHRKCTLMLRIVLSVLTSGSWGQCSSSLLGYVIKSHIFFSAPHLNYLSAPWPSFPTTRGFDRHYVLWSSEFSSVSFRSSWLYATISAFSWYFNVWCPPTGPTADFVWCSDTYCINHIRVEVGLKLNLRNSLSK